MLLKNSADDMHGGPTHREDVMGWLLGDMSQRGRRRTKERENRRREPRLGLKEEGVFLGWGRGCRTGRREEERGPTPKTRHTAGSPPYVARITVTFT